MAVLMEKFKEQNPIVRALILIFLTPNGSNVLISIGIANMIARGMLPPVPVLL